MIKNQISKLKEQYEIILIYNYIVFTFFQLMQTAK